MKYGGRDFHKNDFVKVPNVHKPGYHFRNNFLSYNINQFKVEEMGDLNDILAKNSLNKDLQKDKSVNKMITI